MSEIVLVNTNNLQPPVSPVGLEYVAEALARAGFKLRVIDLAFTGDWKTLLHNRLKNCDALLVGMSVRNTDDCSFLSRQSFIPWIGEVIGEVRHNTGAPIFLGGVGFSVMPDVIVQATGADGGIAGDGEDAIVALARAISTGTDYGDLPNMVVRRGEKIVCNARRDVDLSRLPVHDRTVFDNKKYEELGGMVGIETKRGCGQQCYYCADPVAKGTKMRLRPPHLVVQEIMNLVAQDVTWFHLCDAEFNLPISHAKEFCRDLIKSKLGEKIHWYTYCAPVPFDRELVMLMKKAGCAGINFGVDALCDEQLLRLGRHHSVQQVKQLVDLLHHEQMNYLFDFLIGGPGETRETVWTTIARIKEYNVTGAGIAVGVRVYPGTRLARGVESGIIKDGLYPVGKNNLEMPLFYLAPSLGENVTELMKELVGNDPRFMWLAAPGKEGSYNYAGDDLLSRLIKAGARGAYWDILRKHQTAQKTGL